MDIFHSNPYQFPLCIELNLQLYLFGFNPDSYTCKIIIKLIDAFKNSHFSPDGFKQIIKRQMMILHV